MPDRRLDSILADLQLLRQRVDGINDPSLDGVVNRMVGAESELRRVAARGSGVEYYGSGR